MSRQRKDREFCESADLNNAADIQYYGRLTELSNSMFEWHNLPDDPRFLEMITSIILHQSNERRVE